jgi:hypothetical protein
VVVKEDLARSASLTMNYLIGSIVHRFSEVGMVVAIGRLPAEEEAGVAMPVIGLGAAKADI